MRTNVQRIANPLQGTPKTVAFTGHRPDKLSLEQQARVGTELYCLLRKLRRAQSKLRCISGMAQGVDQIAADVCAELRIPWIAAVPFAGQEDVWPEEARYKYRELIEDAAEFVQVSPGPYSPAKMQRRNMWMVDRADVVWAVWNGSRGGTFNCINYARGRKPVYVLNPIDWTWRKEA